MRLLSSSHDVPHFRFREPVRVGDVTRAVSDYEIFDTWRKGPAAVIRLFERVFGTFVLYGPPTPDQQQRTIDDLSQHIARLKGQVEKLKAENSTLVSDNVRLLRRNHELEARITKDSHNSSRPPSSDPSACKRTKSLRRRAAKHRAGRSVIKATRARSQTSRRAS